MIVIGMMRWFCRAGSIHPARIALVLRAQLAAWISGSGQVPCGGDGLGVLLRLGQVDGDVQLAVLGLHFPLHVSGNPIPADVVGVLAELIVPVGGFLRGLSVQGPELPDHLGGPGGKYPHQPGVQQIPIGNGILLQYAPLNRIIQQRLQRSGQFGQGQLFRQGAAVQRQGLQQGIDRPHPVLRLNEPLLQGIGDQLRDGLIPLHTQTSSKPWGWLLCQAQAEATMVGRSLYLGCQPSTFMAFSEEAMS